MLAALSAFGLLERMLAALSAFGLLERVFVALPAFGLLERVFRLTIGTPLSRLRPLS